jgi:hypothetical protein
MYVLIYVYVCVCGPGAHPASYTMGTSSFPGVKLPGRGIGHPPYLASKLKEE